MSVLGKRLRKESDTKALDQDHPCSKSPPKKKLKAMKISDDQKEDVMDIDMKVMNDNESFAMEAVIDGEIKMITDEILNGMLLSRNTVQNNVKFVQSGKWSVVYFYPYDFEPMSCDNLKGLNEKYSEFQDLNAQIIGISK